MWGLLLILTQKLLNEAKAAAFPLGLQSSQAGLGSHFNITEFLENSLKIQCPFSVFPLQQSLDKIPLPPQPPKKRQKPWQRSKMTKQSKTCQGQDRPCGASQPNKLSRYSLNLLHWFADRKSLACSKTDPSWTPLSVSTVHFEIPY